MSTASLPHNAIFISNKIHGTFDVLARQTSVLYHTTKTLTTPPPPFPAPQKNIDRKARDLFMRRGDVTWPRGLQDRKILGCLLIAGGVVADGDGGVARARMWERGVGVVGLCAGSDGGRGGVAWCFGSGVRMRDRGGARDGSS